MNPHDLMEFARGLAESGHAPAMQARLRRAVSTADYALDTPAYEESDVRDHIASAELAIGQFEQATVDARRGFGVQVLFRQRSP